MEEKCLPVDDASLSYAYAKNMTIHEATEKCEGTCPTRLIANKSAPW